MQFKLDENLPDSLVALLANAGHDAHTVIQERLAGATDLRVAEVCQNEKRTLITFDLDFADIRAYPPRDYPGLIVLRLRSQAASQVLNLFARVVALFEIEQLSGRLWIIEDTQVRIHDPDGS